MAEPNIYLQEDAENELLVLSAIQECFAPLSGYGFTHNGGYATFDFSGYKKDSPVIQIEVKSRDILPERYNEYFVSETKVRESLLKQTYIVYYFIPKSLIRIYDLTTLVGDGLETRELKDWNDKRLGYKESKKVRLIPANKWIAEYYLI